MAGLDQAHMTDRVSAALVESTPVCDQVMLMADRFADQLRVAIRSTGGPSIDEVMARFARRLQRGPA